MTPKEKAQELIKRFRSGMTGPGIEANNRNAPALAIICVEEIIASSDHAGGWDDYWNEVLAILKTNQ